MGYIREHGVGNESREVKKAKQKQKKKENVLIRVCQRVCA
jgi:hypothetical protein